MASEQTAVTVIERPQQMSLEQTIEQQRQKWQLEIQLTKIRIEAIRQLQREVMVEDEDYGTIPGTPKPTLYQVGAQAIDKMIGLRPDPIVLPDSVRDFDTPFFNYEVRVDLIRLDNGEIESSGLGSCNSNESKYHWRDAKRKCPKCDAEAILRSKFADKNTGDKGWYCFNKRGGCGAQFKSGDPTIINQPLGQVVNPDLADLANTILKMAVKRAHVAAAMNVSGVARLFTQDMEDLAENQKAADEERKVKPPAKPQDDSRPLESAADEHGQKRSLTETKTLPMATMDDSDHPDAPPADDGRLVYYDDLLTQARAAHLPIAGLPQQSRKDAAKVAEATAFLEQKLGAQQE